MIKDNWIIILAFLTSIFSMQNALANPLDKLPKQCHFSSKFEQTKTLATLPVPLLSSGELYFSCNYGLIWQTQRPIQEALILTKKNYHFQELTQGSEKSLQSLESLQTQFLSNLLIGLMSADQDYIRKTFNIEEVDKKSFQLIPLNNSLKRAIEKITIQNQRESKELNIDILQTDETKIQIRSHSPVIFDELTTDSNLNTTQCTKIGIAKHLCEALVSPIETANKLDDSAEN